MKQKKAACSLSEETKVQLKCVEANLNKCVFLICECSILLCQSVISTTESVFSLTAKLTSTGRHSSLIVWGLHRDSQKEERSRGVD